MVVAVFAIAPAASAATLSLSPSEETVSVGEVFSVNILLDTEGGVIDGVDINALNFDADILQVIDAYPGVSGVQIESGTLMQSTMVNTVDNEAGRIVFSQVTGSSAPYTSTEPASLAVVTFEAMRQGTAEVTFDYSDGDTTDVNVAAVGSDVLTNVSDGTYHVNGQEASPGILSRIISFFRGLF
jgi:hypothetical protein